MNTPLKKAIKDGLVGSRTRLLTGDGQEKDGFLVLINNSQFTFELSEGGVMSFEYLEDYTWNPDKSRIERIPDITYRLDTAIELELVVIGQDIRLLDENGEILEGTFHHRDGVFIILDGISPSTVMAVDQYIYNETKFLLVPLNDIDVVSSDTGKLTIAALYQLLGSLVDRGNGFEHVSISTLGLAETLGTGFDGKPEYVVSADYAAGFGVTLHI